jgi:hypothetical protein
MTKQPKAAGEPQTSTDGKLSPERRKEILAQALSTRLARPGQWRVETQADYYAVVVGRKPVNHILHLLLSVFTLGFWLIVWLVVAMTGGEKRYKLSVDEYGNGTIEKLSGELVQFVGWLLGLLGCAGLV